MKQFRIGSILPLRADARGNLTAAGERLALSAAPSAPPSGELHGLAKAIAAHQREREGVRKSVKTLSAGATAGFGLRGLARALVAHCIESEREFDTPALFSAGLVRPEHIVSS